MSEEIPMGEAGDPASPVPAGATTTRKCSNCGEWYDARSASCYLCHEEEREYNYALKKAIETERLNGALARQVSGVRQEANAEQQLRSASQDKTGQAYSRVRPNTSGYQELTEGIKNSLEEHPEALDFFEEMWRR